METYFHVLVGFVCGFVAKRNGQNGVVWGFVGFGLAYLLAFMSMFVYFFLAARDNTDIGVSALYLLTLVTGGLTIAFTYLVTRRLRDVSPSGSASSQSSSRSE